MQTSMPVRYAAILLVLLPMSARPLHGQAGSGRLVLRALAGPVVPLGPSDFRAGWHVGPSGAIAIGYALSQRAELAAEIAYGRLGTPEPPQLPNMRFGHHPTPLWAAWLDGSLALAAGRVQPRAHVGAGVIAFGAAKTGLGLRAGVGLETPLSARLSIAFDALLVHAFTDDETELYPVRSSVSYLPIRLGLAWR